VNGELSKKFVDVSLTLHDNFSQLSLNNFQTKTVTMGLNTGTMLPVFTLSGTWGSKVHLTDEEILTLIDELFTPAQEHFAKEDVIVELKYLSDKHSVNFSIFEKKPVIIIAQQPLKQPDDRGSTSGKRPGIGS